MNYKIAIPFIILAFLGGLILGKGLTGFVVSETCCFGEDCAEENLCDSARPNLEAPDLVRESFFFTYVGVFMMLIVLFFYLNTHAKAYYKKK